MSEQGAAERPKDSTDLVHLPTLISNEFGVSRSVAREQIVLGMVLIDGEKWEGDRLDIPINSLTGKEIIVQGRDRSFKMTYREPGYGR